MSEFPVRPEYDSIPELYTFQDAVDHVLDTVAADGQKRAGRLAVRAVHEAYREMPNLADWSSLRRLGRIVTRAQQSEGTVEFQFTGGTYERQLILTGATWPEDVSFCSVRLDRITCPIVERISSTVVTLDPHLCPKQDLEAGTSYILFQDRYPLPASYRRGSRLVELGNGCWPHYVRPQAGMSYYQWVSAPVDPPSSYSIQGAGETYGGMVVQFYPPPSVSRVYDYSYLASPRPLQQFGQKAEHTAGSVTISGTTVTGIGTGWTHRLVGCVLRVATGNKPPVGPFSSQDSSEQYAEWAIVSKVNSGTELIIDRTLEGTYSDVGYSISSPIDLDMDVMWTPFTALADAIYARLVGTKDVPMRQGAYLEALRRAIGADARNEDSPRQMGPVGVYYRVGARDEE